MPEAMMERRFAFGENWRKFLSVLDEQRIGEAELSLRTMLACQNLKGRTFVDIGSGSGLFSLAAWRLGARVHSFDYDRSSVGCTAELKSRYCPDPAAWTVEHGSILDETYVQSLGQFDVVYAWGVLHHTGNMWKALDLAASLVRPKGGVLFVAIYNDQGVKSRFWKLIKKSYCLSPRWFRPLVATLGAAALWGPKTLLSFICLRPFKEWRNYGRQRGMSPWWDVVDWVGGYPFEVAKTDDITNFYSRRGFVLRRLEPTTGAGNNQFVFDRTS